ncbi:MAG: metalloregulator ArsR/SmtB family transcription factor [Candidatus Thiothrix putei]|uniref:Metalloregulator ArsR/SmtB family transcription factor n=1 Tax=Candidatus Thiothrix putei TaxID=3080811 RepID=A0AA95HBY5_9GAMM|nr:MAG: metalloregulator ArsR/SmtB family transcription factor [Candidatus Thiothrix putei]
MQLEIFTKALADQTRLRILLLLAVRRELCVCELTQALELAQPKISRHLAVLRESGLLQDRKTGLWVYYRLHPDLPQWATATLDNLHSGSMTETLFLSDRQRLDNANRIGESCTS